MFAIFNRFAIETHKSTDCNVCLRVCVNGVCVRANVCKFLVVCLFVCVCGCMCISVDVYPCECFFSCLCFLSKYSCECLWECMCISVDVYPCECFFPCLLCCLDTIVSVCGNVCISLDLLACAVFEWICACLTVCQKAC